MNPRFFFLFLLFFPNLNIRAQFYTLIKPRENSDSINVLIHQAMYEKDAVAAYKIMRNISGINNRTYTKEQQLEYEILKAFYDYFTAAKTPPLVLKQLKHVAEQGKKEGNIYAETAALRIIAESYKLIDYEKAFDILHQLNDRISPIDEKAFAYKAECFNQIGQQYYFLSDYTTAIHYLQKSLTIKETAINWGAIWSSYDVLGLCFQKLNRLDSSDYFFRKAMESPYIKTGSIFYTILQGNLAKNYFLRGQYQEALPLAIIDFNKAAEVGDHDLAANAAVLVSKIYIKFNDKKSFGEWLKKAAFYHEKVRLYKNKSERFYERAPEIYSLMSKWHNINGEKTVANNYLDSVMMAKDTLNVKLNTIYLLRATQSEQNKLKEKAQAEEEKFRLTERVKNSQLVILLLVVLFLLIISVLIYRNQQRKRKMEQLENRLKLSVVEDKLSDTEQKFREAQQLLQDFIAKVAEKENQIAKLNADAENNTEELNAVLQSVIITPNDWNNFKMAFETLHPLFFLNIKEKIPNVSTAEMRLLALFKLKLSRKEIAHTLGISHDSVHVTWHRIRKKMLGDPKEKITPEKFVEEM